MNEYPITPAQLAAELGHLPEARPGKRIRDYLRTKYSDRQPHQRWLLDEDQANDVRAHFRTDLSRLNAQETLDWLLATVDPALTRTRGLLTSLRALIDVDGRIDDEAGLGELLNESMLAVFDLEQARSTDRNNVQPVSVPITVFGKKYDFPVRLDRS